MFPMLPFVVGVTAGVFTVKALKSEKTQKAISGAVRDAKSGLTQLGGKVGLVKSKEPTESTAEVKAEAPKRRPARKSTTVSKPIRSSKTAALKTSAVKEA